MKQVLEKEMSIGGKTISNHCSQFRYVSGFQGKDLDCLENLGVDSI